VSRVGLGFDAHPFDTRRALRLGGLEWKGEPGLKGHSDGDVLLHAVCDALLGAAGKGSMGEYFSDTDPSKVGRDSREMLRETWRMISADFSIGNIDATVVGERPRIQPRRSEIQGAIASLLGVPAERVSIRGTSSNGLGFPGRGEGLAAMAVVLLEPHTPSPSP
jgi:2-C-methyl-D-erythritol 2,4-cyclodiphosphate synthase